MWAYKPIAMGLHRSVGPYSSPFNLDDVFQQAYHQYCKCLRKPKPYLHNIITYFAGGRLLVQKHEHGPANTLLMEFQVDGSSKQVNVDITPCIHISAFPSQINWPRSGVRWPPSDKITEIKRMGVNLVAKKNYHWAISFSECEKALAYNMDADRGQRKKCHRILKCVNEDFWYISIPHKKCPLSSYHIKVSAEL